MFTPKTLFDLIINPIGMTIPIFRTKFNVDKIPHFVPDISAPPKSSNLPPEPNNLKSFLNVAPAIGL